MYDPYTDWILKHYKDYRNCPELIKALKDNFGLDGADEKGIKYWFANRLGMTTVYGRNEFSEKEKEFIKKYYPDYGPNKTTEMINYIFKTNRTINSVKCVVKSLGLSVSDSYICDLNKNKSELMIKAHKKESGSIRKETYKDGRIYYKMKSADGRWKMAGLVIWEEANGPIPDGYRIIYLDGDNSNYKLDNLYVAPKKVTYQVVTNKNYQSGDPEITKSLIKYYELRNALGIDWVEWRRKEVSYGRSNTSKQNH